MHPAIAYVADMGKQIKNIAICRPYLEWNNSKYFIPSCRKNDFLSSFTCLAQTECVSWRQTGGCVPNGPREPQHDKPCNVDIPGGASGYCQCTINGQYIEQGKKECTRIFKYRNCNEACKVVSYYKRSFFTILYKCKKIL